MASANDTLDPSEVVETPVRYSINIYPYGYDVLNPVAMLFNTIEEKREYIELENKFTVQERRMYAGAIDAPERKETATALAARRARFAGMNNYGPLRMNKMVWERKVDTDNSVA